MAAESEGKKAKDQDEMKNVADDDSLSEYIDNYIQYRDNVGNSCLGKTAQYWMKYTNHVWQILELIEAVKLNDYPLYMHCMHSMPDIFFSFGGQNYARYLTYASVFLANIEESHPGATELLQSGAISVARSFIPGNRCAVDKTMEETFMKHVKSHGGAGGSGAGLSGILSNYAAYQRWIRTTHEISKYLSTTLSMADMLADTGDDARHRDLRPAEIVKSGKCVERTKEAIQSFINPFDVDDQERLYCISSGAPAPLDIESSVMAAESEGKKAKDQFIVERLEKKEHFFEPVKKLNLKSMADMNKKVKLKNGKNKTIEYKQQGNIAFQLLVKSQDEGLQLDLKELMTYQLTPVPYAIGTADGFLAKTDKSKGFHYLTKEVEDATIPPSQTTLDVEDGNACFHYLKTVPGHFKQISEKVFDMMSRKTDVIFSTDMYKADSVKSMERQRRGTGEKLIIKGESTKKPENWNTFLANDENKKQLVRVMLKVWNNDSFAEKINDREITLICDGKAYQLKSDNGQINTTEIESLKSTQEETDSRVILYAIYGKENGYEYVRIKSPDSDIFFITLHYALQLGNITVLFDTGTGNKKRLIDISEIAQGYTQEYCTALLSLHAFTGCDSTSAFKGMDKVKGIQIMQKMPKYVPVLACVGDEWEVSEETIDELESFTCAMYGHSRFTNINELRLFMLKTKCGNSDKLSVSNNVDISSLPPCRDSLEQHIRRVNYQVAIWKKATIAIPQIPHPTDGHGWVHRDGHIEPLWTSTDVLPQALIDIIEEVQDCDTSDDEDDNDIEPVYSDDQGEESD